MPFDPKSGELTSVLQPSLFDVSHQRAAWPNMAPRDQLLQLVAPALGHQLDSAVVCVADPACYRKAVPLVHR